MKKRKAEKGRGMRVDSGNAVNQHDMVSKTTGSDKKEECLWIKEATK
jgi:hypothetical protein